LGILTPAVILSFTGNRLLATLKKFTKTLAIIERWAALLIIFSGVYISAELLMLTSQDILIAGAIAAIEICFIAFLILRRSNKQTLLNYLMIGVLLISDFIATLLLASQAPANDSVSGIALVHSCNGSKVDCPVCALAAIVFLLLASGLAVSYLISEHKGKRVKFTLE
jgi:hypothetical protein